MALVTHGDEDDVVPTSSARQAKELQVCGLGSNFLNHKLNFFCSGGLNGHHWSAPNAVLHAPTSAFDRGPSSQSRVAGVKVSNGLDVGLLVNDNLEVAI